jgi:1,4-alpha-glucan branching enzyme
VAAFARDQESSSQVWSATEGYPGDPAYRDFYRDVGFDAPLEHVAPYVHPDGIRVHTGFKYHRVTGKVDLSQKHLYDPHAARERAAVHAGNFLHNRQLQTRHLAEYMDRPPHVVSPYDAELYGHWWFEGPQFLDFLFRKMHFDQDEIEAVTCSDVLTRYPANAVAEPATSSWGEGGYSSVWVDGTNDWIYQHQHRAEARMVALAQQHGEVSDNLVRRALNQMARELLLLQSSDWAFIDEAWLADLERRDNIFPDIDFRSYR